MNKAKVEAWFFLFVGLAATLTVISYVERLSYWEATVPLMAAILCGNAGLQKLIAANKSGK